MSCTEVLKAHVPPDIKRQVKTVAERDFLSEAVWLRRLVLREIRSCLGANGEERKPCLSENSHHLGRERRDRSACGKPMLVRLSIEDRLLLDARADARGMRPATYVAVLARSHLRALTPLPKDELLALRRAIGELAAIGRNLNQIAKAANEDGRLPGSAREEFRAMLKVCEALRDSTKALLKANEVSWSTGHG